VFPNLLVIPNLDAFDDATFAGEADDEVSPFWPNPALNGLRLGRAISEVDDDTVEENGIAANPHLNGAKDAITARNLDLVVIPSAVNLGSAQEIPYLSSGRQTNRAGNSKKTRQRLRNTFQH
jgi:hypothetical protein